MVSSHFFQRVLGKPRRYCRPCRRRNSPERENLSSRSRREEKSSGSVSAGEEGPEKKRTISLGGGEIPITLFPSFFYKSRSSSSNFLWAIFCVFGIFFGILFTKNALQSVLQGISAERTRFELVIRLPVCRFSKPVDSATLPPLQSHHILSNGTANIQKFPVFLLLCNGVCIFRRK